MQTTCKLDVSQHLLCIVLSATFCSRRVPFTSTKVREMSPHDPGWAVGHLQRLHKAFSARGLSVGGSVLLGEGRTRV